MGGGTEFSERRFARQGVTIVQPVAPDWTEPAVAEAHARRLVNLLESSAPFWLWFNTPMALTIVAGLHAAIVIFDKTGCGATTGLGVCHDRVDCEDRSFLHPGSRKY